MSHLSSLRIFFGASHYCDNPNRGVRSSAPPPHWDNLTGGAAGAVLRPVGHQTAALLKQVTAAIGRLNLITNRVPERLRCDVIGIAGALAHPVSKGAAKAVDHGIPAGRRGGCAYYLLQQVLIASSLRPRPAFAPMNTCGLPFSRGSDLTGR